MNGRSCLRIFAVLLLPLLIAACAKEPPPANVKVGKPYQIYGKWYKPAIESNYDEVGMASWYGPGFHGNYTASGERFDKNSLTAAHTTLPMPCMVRVTNLANNRSVIVRINDRGPFSSNRIIDLSRKAAEGLDMLKTGTARVRVQYLPEETEKYLVENNIKGREQILNSASTRSLNKQQLARSDRPYGGTVDAAPVETVSTISQNQSSAEDSAAYAQESSYHEASSVQTVQVRDVPPTAAAPASVYSDRSPSYPAPVPQATPESATARSTPALHDAFEYASDSTQRTTNSSQPTAATSASGSAGAGIYIQAGTFGNRDNAVKLVNRLSGQGAAEIAEINIQGTTMYRVRMGPLSSMADATSALQNIHQIGITDARLIKN